MDAKLRNAPLNRILWMDLEMTGLSPSDDLILEVAAIVTDWDFKEIATYEGIVKNKFSLMKERMALNSVFWDGCPGSRDQLLDQNRYGKSLGKIEGELMAFVEKNFDKKAPVLIGGNSIHNDRKFIVSKWPKLDRRLHYRMLDVSAWKVVFSNKYKKVFMSSDSHRAIDDVRGSINEMEYYLSSVK